MSHSTENLNISDRHSQSAAFLSGEHFTSDRKNQSTIFICDAMNIQVNFFVTVIFVKRFLLFTQFNYYY